ncbi:toprim domain-containing protein [Streptomyces sp. NPDC087862]|uniref:toprim domain-containing protein n=1 Tax=Streptomyces sp. NPDC087862 TaxID=3365813 RepID=UPI00380EB431
MSKLSASQRVDLITAAKRYSSRYEGSPAEELIVGRGLGELAGKLGLGFVSEPVVGHERYRDHLAIPYLRPAGGQFAVATLRFRRIGTLVSEGASNLDEFEDSLSGAKYLSLPGHSPLMYNTQALLTHLPYIALCEGELDAATAELAGVPAVGLPGVSSWRDHFGPAFAGFETVFVIGDGDQAGRQFTQKMCERLPNAKPIDLGDGYDVNSFTQQYGYAAFRGRLGL